MTQFVFRYLNQEFGLLALQQRVWKIGRLLDLNDPLDCQPRLVRNGLEDGPQVGDDPYFRDIYDRFGVICYSSSITDPVIWSHYADSHRGMALGFRFRDEDGLFEMHYPPRDERPELDLDLLERLKAEDSDQALLKVISHGFTRKAKSWSYEKEFRHFVSLSGCTMTGPHYFRGLPVNSLERVILGVRCPVSEGDIRRIVDTWQHHRPVEISRAEIDPRSFKLRA